MASDEVIKRIYDTVLADGGDRKLNAIERNELNLYRRLRDCSDQAAVRIMQMKGITITQFLYMMALTTVDKDKQAHIWGYKDDADLYEQARALQDRLSEEAKGKERKITGWMSHD